MSSNNILGLRSGDTHIERVGLVGLPSGWIPTSGTITIREEKTDNVIVNDQPLISVTGSYVEFDVTTLCAEAINSRIRYVGEATVSDGSDFRTIPASEARKPFLIDVEPIS